MRTGATSRSVRLGAKADSADANVGSSTNDWKEQMLIARAGRATTRTRGWAENESVSGLQDFSRLLSGLRFVRRNRTEELCFTVGENAKIFAVEIRSLVLALMPISQKTDRPTLRAPRHLALARVGARRAHTNRRRHWRWLW